MLRSAWKAGDNNLRGMSRILSVRHRTKVLSTLKAPALVVVCQSWCSSHCRRVDVVDALSTDADQPAQPSYSALQPNCKPISCDIQAAVSAGDVIELLSSDDEAASRPGLGTAEPQLDLPGTALGCTGRYSEEGGRPGSSTAQPAAGPTGDQVGDMQQAACQPVPLSLVQSLSTGMQDSDERAAGASGSDSEAASLGSQEGPRASRSLLAAEGRRRPGQAQQAQARRSADPEGTQHLGPQEEAPGQVQGAAQGAAAARHQLWAHHQRNRQEGAAACSQQATQAALTEAAQAGAAARSVLLAAALFALQRADHLPTSELTVQDAADAAEPTPQRGSGVARTLPAGASAVSGSPPDRNKAEATTVHDAKRMWTPFEVATDCF